MSLPPGFKATQTTESWLKEHAGHAVWDTEQTIRTEGGTHRQLWKICATCNTGQLCGVEHSWIASTPCTDYSVGDDDAKA